MPQGSETRNTPRAPVAVAENIGLREELVRRGDPFKKNLCFGVPRHLHSEQTAARIIAKHAHW